MTKNIGKSIKTRLLNLAKEEKQAGIKKELIRLLPTTNNPELPGAKKK